MSFTDFLRTVFEIALVTFTLWAVFHEDKFAAIEETLFSNFKRRKLKVAKAKSGNIIKVNFQE